MRAVLALLPVAALLTVPLLTPACVIPSISSSEDAGSSAATSTDAASPGTVQGANCTQVTATVSVCQYISVCPNLVLSPQVFPQCGFRIHGSAIDPECLCQGHYLCPIGSPSTCTEAASLASGDTNYDSVCQQALQGRCLDLTAGSSSSGGTPSACQTCIAACNNVPSCIDACGC